MSRQLSDHEWLILKKLAPEINDDGICSSSHKHYRSIMAPLVKHFSSSAEDFANRLELLSDDDFKHILDRAENDVECVSCLHPEYRDVYLKLVEKRASPEKAAALRNMVNEQIMKYGEKNKAA